MPRICTVCAHTDRAAIERAIVAGTANTTVSSVFVVSESAVRRHAASHLPVVLLKATDADEVAHADDLLGQLRALQAQTLRLLNRAEESDKLMPAVLAVREARGNLELLAKLLHQLDERPTLNLILAPEWLTVRAVLLATLAPYPEARAAVAEQLARVEAG